MPCALTIFDHLRTHGYKVRAELADHAAPFTPTISATRDATAFHIEVVGAIDIERLKEWVAYGKSLARDTRLSICTPIATDVQPATITVLKGLGVGLFLVDGARVTESAQPADLAMKIELPKLSNQPQRVRALLGHAYEQFDRGEWREGFESACNALEEEARRYFVHWSKTGRIKIPSKRGPKQMTASEIRGLTLGQLAAAFRNILTPNSLDVSIEQALTKVNPDRVERTHRRRDRRTENRLRRNVGQHMWLIANILKKMQP